MNGQWCYNLFSLAEKYEPVYAKWTTERCAVCRWVEDWDYNKIIICNRSHSIFSFYLIMQFLCSNHENIEIKFAALICRFCSLYLQLDQGISYNQFLCFFIHLKIFYGKKYLQCFHIIWLQVYLILPFNCMRTAHSAILPNQFSSIWFITSLTCNTIC